MFYFKLIFQSLWKEIANYLTLKTFLTTNAPKLGKLIQTLKKKLVLNIILF
jgi:hypothetical protein